MTSSKWSHPLLLFKPNPNLRPILKYKPKTMVMQVSESKVLNNAGQVRKKTSTVCCLKTLVVLGHCDVTLHDASFGTNVSELHLQKRLLENSSASKVYMSS